MLKKAKKGFTIIELVIVIAVIAILAAVLIPTFTSVVDNAKESAALSEAKNAYTEYLSDHMTDDGYPTDNLYIESSGYWFEVKDGELNVKPLATAPSASGVALTYDKAKVYVNVTNAATAIVEIFNNASITIDTNCTYYVLNNGTLYEITFDSDNKATSATAQSSNSIAGFTVVDSEKGIYSKSTSTT